MDKKSFFARAATINKQFLISQPGDTLIRESMGLPLSSMGLSKQGGKARASGAHSDCFTRRMLHNASSVGVYGKTCCVAWEGRAPQPSNSFATVATLFTSCATTKNTWKRWLFAHHDVGFVAFLSKFKSCQLPSSLEIIFNRKLRH